MIYSIVRKSQLEGGLRLDAEYYQPEYLDVEKRLDNINTKTVEEISESVVNFGAYSLCNYIEWQDEGVPYLNVQNIKDGYIDFEDVKFIDERVNEILKKSKVREGQVIITMAGTIGNAAIAHKVPKKLNSNQATAKIMLKKGISPYYLAAFLSCYYGRKQTEREIVSSVQPNIFLFQIKNFKAPVFPQEQQRQIEQIYKRGLNELEKAKTFYSQAENLLLEKLGIKDFETEDEIFNVVNLSKVKDANRIDAEYFQSKYERLISKIRKRRCKLLSELVEMRKGIEPGSASYQEQGLPFIRVSNIIKQGIVGNNQKYISNELYQKLKNNFEPKKGEILLTKDATPGIAYALKEPTEGIISGGILRLELKPKTKIEPEYLALVVNSIVGQMQVERDTGGSVIVHWRPEQIKNCLIPILPKPIQQKIADLVQKSHQARKKAKQLLEQAKQNVERLIAEPLKKN